MNIRSFLIGLILVAFLVAPLAQVVYAQPVPPREETVVVGGGMWAPPTNFNPLVPWAATTGTIGLIYETLYLYLPNKDEWVPWLASGMPEWLSEDTLRIKLRDAYWWDGKPLTSDDVKFTFYDILIKLPMMYYASIRNYLVSVETPDKTTVIFHFNKTSLNYPQLYLFLYSVPVLPKHVFEPIINEKGSEVLNMPIIGADKPVNIVGSGMYKVYLTTSDTLYYVRVDNWWGRNYFGTPGPKYIKYVMVFSNQVALAMILRGDLDWSNFFIPGIPQLVKQYNIVTYYKKSPYYLPANVAYLFVNHNKTPLNDPIFRKALYYAIDVDRILKEVYEGAVLKANPVGLIEIPGWEVFLAKDLIAQYGYGYNPDKAKQLLDSAGYVDKNGDGWRETPDGRSIVLRITVPYGWTDWMQAAIIIADNLKAVGIRAEPDFPAYEVYAERMYKGEFDLLINNFGSFVSPSPWTLYNWLFWTMAPPTGEYSWSGNFGRYFNDNVSQLLTEIARTPLTDIEKLKQLYRQLEKILLDEMPYLPLWYNAYWFQATTLYWEGWPSEDNGYGVPVSWPGRWQDGGLLVLLNLRKVVPTKTEVTAIAITTTAPPMMVTQTAPPVTVTQTVAAGMAPEILYSLVGLIIIIIVAIAIVLWRRRLGH